MEQRPSNEDLEALSLYDPTSPDATDQLRLLMDAFDLRRDPRRGDPCGWSSLQLWTIDT